jgi:phosphatidylethanolamine/phosphatidyl-N-methylethanolamine N-methyltransferase
VSGDPTQAALRASEATIPPPKPLDNTHVEEAYARWAPIYDLAFAAVMRAGRKAATAAANRIGGHILDVGVGTGLELPMFDRNLRVVGVDLCASMLRRAHRRVIAKDLRQVAGLAVMDAMHLGFPDNFFDAVVVPYVLTVVPKPEPCLDEWLRVVRSGGEIILVNHIGAETGLIALFEAWLGRHSQKLGWQPEFPWSIIGNWLAAHPEARLVERRLLSPFGIFTLARIQKL